MIILKNSFKLIHSSSSLRKIVLLGLMITPFVGYLRNFHPPYFQQSQVSTYWLGISLGIAGILAMFVSKNAYKLEKLLGINAIFIATLLPSFFYLLMSFIFHPIFSVLLFTFNYGFMSLQEPFLADYYNIHIKTENRATTLSAINMLSSIYIALIGLVIGRLADYSLSYAFVFMGAIILVGSIVFKLEKKHTISNLTN